MCVLYMTSLLRSGDIKLYIIVYKGNSSDVEVDSLNLSTHFEHLFQGILKSSVI